MDVYSNLCKEADLLPSGPTTRPYFQFRFDRSVEMARSGRAEGARRRGRGTIPSRQKHLNSFISSSVQQILVRCRAPAPFATAAVITTSPSHRDHGSVLAVRPCLAGAAQTRAESSSKCGVAFLAPSIRALRSPLKPGSRGGGAGEMCHTSNSYQQPLNIAYHYTRDARRTPREPRWKEQSTHCD